ncbi:hypothetical protein DPMN_104692 [Dreissena polymorpha]|uniref:Uncharacterized protein n=2 Tax=Dreissena polymorpha TaxID=45954 RepID=A0A9D4K0A1_DREPO|nr:hypothetical protein DPMN_104692 [Dreissena polymorpha]
MIKILRGQKHFESLIKVIISNGKCDVGLSTDPSELDVKCLCQSINSLICNVSASSVNAEDKWRCAALRYQDQNPIFSRIRSLSGYNENDITIGQTTMSSTINYKKEDATSDQTNVFRDNEMPSPAGVSKETHEDTFIIVFATSGGLIILIAVVLITTYWKCVRNTGAVLTPVVENHYLTPLGDNPRLSEYVVGRGATGNRSDDSSQRHVENTNHTPLRDNPRISQYAVGRESHVNRNDSISRRHFENIDCDLKSVVNACVTNGDVESRANDERTSENQGDIISRQHARDALCRDIRF